MSLLNQHLPVLPVAIPMVAAALMVMLRDKRRHYKLLIAFGSLLAQLFCAVYLLLLADGTLAPIWPQSVGVYLLGGLAGPLRNRSGRGPFGRLFAGSDQCARFLLLVLFTGPLGPRRGTFPFPVPVAIDGSERRFPDG